MLECSFYNILGSIPRLYSYVAQKHLNEPQYSLFELNVSQTII